MRYGLGFPIWGDEAFLATNFVQADFARLFRPLIYGQIAPLGFLWAELAASRLLGLSEWALRLLPFVAGCAALLLFWLFARRVLPRRAAVLGLVFFAPGYYLVRHGAEAKPYATDLLVGLVLTILAWRVVERSTSHLRWLCVTLAAGIGVWCSYPAAFVAAAVTVVLALHAWQTRAWRDWAWWVVFSIVLAASFLAMQLSFAGPHAEEARRLIQIDMWAQAFPPYAQPWKLPLWLIGVHTGRMFAYPFGGSVGSNVVQFALFVFGAVVLWRRDRRLFALLIGPVVFTFIAASVRAYPYGGSARTSLYLAPAICLLAGLGVHALLVGGGRRFFGSSRHALRVGLLVAAALAVIVFVVSVIRDVREPYKNAAVLRSHDAVLKFAASTAPTDRWIVFNADRRVPYAPYLGDWRGVGGQFVFDVLRFSPVPLNWCPPLEELSPPESNSRTWLLVYRANSDKVTFPNDQLDAYLAAARARLGPYEHQVYPVKDEPRKKESIEAYRFGGD